MREEGGFFSTITKDGLCVPCDLDVRQKKEEERRETPSQINAVTEQIAGAGTISDQHYAYLETLEPPERNDAYIALVDRFLADGELDAQEGEMLQNLYERLALDPVDSTFIDRVLPSLYVAAIRNEDALPTVPREPLMDMDIILKKGETPHYICKSALKEIRVKTGFRAGSQGVSLRVMKGVSYRVGGARGHVTREEQLVETSRGTLLITDKRLFLHPDGDTKPVSIPIGKILSYKCYDDGVVLYKDGREKSFVFSVSRPGEAETIGICLGFLCADL